MSISYKRGRTDALKMVPRISAFCRWFVENDGVTLADLVKGLTVDDAAMLSYYAACDSCVKQAINTTLALSDPKTQSESQLSSSESVCDGESHSPIDHVSETLGMEDTEIGEEPLQSNDAPAVSLFSLDDKLSRFMRDNYDTQEGGYITLDSIWQKLKQESDFFGDYKDLFVLGTGLKARGYEVRRGFMTHLELRLKADHAEAAGSDSPWMSANI